MCRSERGQSEVIGLVLLIGLSMFVIGSAVVMGGSTISDLSTQTNAENAGNSISDVESEMSAVAIGSSETRRVSLSRTTDGIYYVDPDSGAVTITHTVSGTEEWNVSRRLGAVVYNGSERDVAYQGGGVWMKQGNYTSTVSSPEYHYRDSSLTFPIVQITNPGSKTTEYGNIISGTELESGELEYPLTEGTVRVSVQSQYYQGWHEFFEQRTDGEATIYHSNNTATTELVVPDTFRLDNTLSLEATYDPKNNKQIVPEDELEDNVPHPSADSLIEGELSSASSNNDNDEHACVDTGGFSSGCTLTSGTYYINSDVDLNGDLTLDVSDGDITIATDGNFDIGSNAVNVIGDSQNSVDHYLNGSLRGDGNGEITHASGGDATQNRIFVGESFLDESEGGGTVNFEAIIYAPDADIVENGNFEILGALIAYDLDVNSNAAEINRGGVPEDYVLDITGTEDTIQFLHVTTNRVTAELKNNDLFVSKYHPTASNGCEWVESAFTSGDLDIDGEVVACDISNEIDDETVDTIDLTSESVLIGYIDGSGTVDVDRSHVVGGITTSEGDVTITSDSIVEGAVVVEEGTLTMDRATIEGHVYADEDDITCSNTEIGPNGESCDEYEFRDPAAN